MFIIIMDGQADIVENELYNLSDDVLSLLLMKLPLRNQISIRRVCKRFQSISDVLLGRIRKINKEDLQSLSFDGREWLLKGCNLKNLQVVSLVSIELNEDLARHMACHSPLLERINVDGTCYNRSFEFIEHYLITFETQHPIRPPALQVTNLIEMDEKLIYLLDKFPKWSVKLNLQLSTLGDWKAYFHHVHKIVISKNCFSSFQDLPSSSAQLKSAFPYLQVIVFSGVTIEDCFHARSLVEISEEVVFENLSIHDYAVILVLEGVYLKYLTVNLNHYKDTKTRTHFLQTVCDYLKFCGQKLKFVKISTSFSEDSIKLVKTLIRCNMRNVGFEIGNPSEMFTFLDGSLRLKFWNDSLEQLLNTFSKAREVKITTSSNFDVFEAISQIKAFAAKRRNCSININLSIQSHPESVSVIPINGDNYKLTIPKIVGLNFNLSCNNALFAFNLAERSQLTDLRNKSLNFMKFFLGNQLSKDSRSAQEICDQFKSSTQ